MLLSARQRRYATWMPGLVVLLGGGAAAAEALPIRELRTQRVGETTYFHVCFAPPASVGVPGIEWKNLPLIQQHRLARLPQLVPQDGRAFAVYLRMEIPHQLPDVGLADELRPPVPVTGLEFVGKWHGTGKARFLLRYANEPAAPADGKEKESLADLLDGLRRPWTETVVELDLARAQQVPALDRPVPRRPVQAPTRDDLQGLWAEGQAARFAVLEILAPDFGFPGFACGATGRKYGVRDPALERARAGKREEITRQLYETTTGTTAIVQSLQTNRRLNPSYWDKAQRTVDIASVSGITIGEHPWKRMMAGKEPAPEPLARLVPPDNYYVHFRSIRKLIEFGEWLDQWGTTAIRAYEMNSRDYGLKERYEKQICLRSSWLGKALGPALVHGVALTGSDTYLREGSDITLIFHVVSKRLFLSGVEQFLDAARQEHGADLQESQADYHGIRIESFVTPLRAVSLHRAAFDDFVVYSNSPAGLRRVLDVHQGRRKSLAEALDFQYMRTVFRADAAEEDGFLFLSDAFIRQLVGPASKIKEKRRLEALASLEMTTHAALFAAWETGRLPADHMRLLAGAGLKQTDLYVPEGKPIAWDAARRVAVSEAYNTMHFATPLVELPIDRITASENQEYAQFRQQYQALWRQFFDPVGVRFALHDRQVRIETYILPMIQINEYQLLRTWTSGGTTPLDPARIAPVTLAQFLVHLAPMLSGFLPGLGNWAMIRLDDSAAFDELLELWLRKELDPRVTEALDRPENFWKLPFTLGVGVKDAKQFTEHIKTWTMELKGEPLNPPYKGVAITRFELNNPDLKMALYHAFIDDGWYVSSSVDVIRQLIDSSAARRDAKAATAKENPLQGNVPPHLVRSANQTAAPAGKHEPVQVNSSLYLAPEAAFRAGKALRSYLAWESGKRAVANCPSWYTLYRCGLVQSEWSEKPRRAAARTFLGHVPVSPDGSAYSYDPRTDEVTSLRHGTQGAPKVNLVLDESSPLFRLLGELRTIRADLRFREDGIHTVLTIERRGEENGRGR